MYVNILIVLNVNTKIPDQKETKIFFVFEKKVFLCELCLANRLGLVHSNMHMNIRSNIMVGT